MGEKANELLEEFFTTNNSLELTDKLKQDLPKLFEFVVQPTTPNEIIETHVQDIVKTAKQLETIFINAQTYFLTDEKTMLEKEIRDLEEELERKEQLIQRSSNQLKKWEEIFGNVLKESPVYQEGVYEHSK